MSDDRTCALCGCKPERDERGVIHWYHRRAECSDALYRLTGEYPPAAPLIPSPLRRYCRMCTRCQSEDAQRRGVSAYVRCSADDDAHDVVCCWCGQPAQHWIYTDAHAALAIPAAHPWHANGLGMPAHCTHLRAARNADLTGA